MRASKTYCWGLGVVSVQRVGWPVDDPAHLLLDHNIGRDNGTIVRHPTADGFDELGSLPEPVSDVGALYSTETVDLDGDGRYGIAESRFDCNPSCATGTTTIAILEWDGSNYIPLGHPAGAL